MEAPTVVLRDAVSGATFGGVVRVVYSGEPVPHLDRALVVDINAQGAIERVTPNWEAGKVYHSALSGPYKIDVAPPTLEITGVFGSVGATADVSITSTGQLVAAFEERNNRIKVLIDRVNAAFEPPSASEIAPLVVPPSPLPDARAFNMYGLQADADVTGGLMDALNNKMGGTQTPPPSPARRNPAILRMNSPPVGGSAVVGRSPSGKLRPYRDRDRSPPSQTHYTSPPGLALPLLPETSTGPNERTRGFPAPHPTGFRPEMATGVVVPIVQSREGMPRDSGQRDGQSVLREGFPAKAVADSHILRAS